MGTSVAEHGRCLPKSVTETEQGVVRMNDAESAELWISLLLAVAMTSRLLLNPHHLRTIRKRSTLSSPYLLFSKKKQLQNNFPTMTSSQTKGQPTRKTLKLTNWPTF